MRLMRLRMSLKACGHGLSWGWAEPRGSLRPPSPGVCTRSPDPRILRFGQQSAARPADQGSSAATCRVRSTGTGRGEVLCGPGSGPWFPKGRADGWRRLGLDGRYCCYMNNPQVDQMEVREPHFQMPPRDVRGEKAQGPAKQQLRPRGGSQRAGLTHLPLRWTPA